jgi:soluble cytochrome b562
MQENSRSDIKNLTFDEKLARLKTLKNDVLEKAKEWNAFKRQPYFGYERDVIDETVFPDELKEMKLLLDQLQYSDRLHNKFDQARKELTNEILSGHHIIINRLDDFDALSEEGRVKLAQDISKRFHELFLGRDYRYVCPEITYNPDDDRSWHRSFALKSRWQWRPKAGKIIFSKNVMCNPQNKEGFLNLVFHEACVHAPMYQLLQGFRYGRVKKSDPLYQDAKLAYGFKRISLAAPFQIASIYPNFIEEALAFKQSVIFANDLGCAPQSDDNKIILSSKSRHRPYIVNA